MAGPRAGYVAKVRVGAPQATPTFALALQRYAVRERGNAQETTNTEGKPGFAVGSNTPGFESHIPANLGCGVELFQPTFDDDENLFALDPPVQISVGLWISCRVYPAGVAPGFFWDFPLLLIDDVDYSGDARSLQPIGVRGIGDGVWVEPAQGSLAALQATRGGMILEKKKKNGGGPSTPG